MNKTFLFRSTDSTVDYDRTKTSDLRDSLETALDRTVIVQTKNMIGGGVVLGDKVITSYILVANFQEVFVRFRRGKKMIAFVTRRDSNRNLAELVPSDRTLTSQSREHIVNSPNPTISKMREIGHPLIVVNVATGVPAIKVAGMLYVTIVSERFEDIWKINHFAPKGLMGGGVWNIDGEFLGISIGEKIPPITSQKLESPSVYALPGEEVMNFAESSN